MLVWMLVGSGLYFETELCSTPYHLILQQGDQNGKVPKWTIADTTI